MKAFIDEHEIACPTCGKHNWTDIRQFNLMFKTFQRRYREQRRTSCYLRPETAQGIFVNFARTSSAPPASKLPVRRLVRWARPSATRSPRATSPSAPASSSRWNCEFFCKPGTDLEWFSYWKDYCENWLLSLGIKKEHLRLRDHEPAELAFYSRATTDIEYAFPFTDWGELWGIADRTNFDLSQPSGGLRQVPRWNTSISESQRAVHPVRHRAFAGLLTAWRWLSCARPTTRKSSDRTSKGKEDVRTVLRLHPALAPVQVLLSCRCARS